MSGWFLAAGVRCWGEQVHICIHTANIYTLDSGFVQNYWLFWHALNVCLNKILEMAFQCRENRSKMISVKTIGYLLHDLHRFVYEHFICSFEHCQFCMHILSAPCIDSVTRFVHKMNCILECLLSWLSFSSGSLSKNRFHSPLSPLLSI